jgi:cysteine synthase A
MHQAGQKGSIVTMACDAGERYSDTYYNDAWLQEKGYNIQPYLEQLQCFYDTGQWNG